MSDTKPTYVDDGLYERIQAAVEFDLLGYLEINRDHLLAQRETFKSGELRNPEFNYHKITDEALTKMNSYEADLLALRKELRGADRTYARTMAGGWKDLAPSLDNSRRYGYLWKINEMLAKVRCVKAVAHKRYRRAQRYCTFVYGKPDAEMLRATVAEVRAEVTCWREAQPDNEDLRRVSDELLALLPNVEPAEYYPLPSSEDIARLQKFVREEFAPIISYYEMQYGASACRRKIEESADLPFVTVSEASAGFAHAMLVLKLFEFGFKLVVTKEKGGYSVSQTDKACYVPATPSTQIKPNELCRYTIHEVGVHPVRRVNGHNSKLHLLEFGLDRYEAGEEGSALGMEDAYTGQVLGYGLPTGPLGVGLALGLDGTPRDFRSLHDVMWRYAACRRLGPLKMDLKAATEQASNLAYDNTARTFRSGDPSAPGSVLTRDAMVYRLGSRRFWKVVAEHPERLAWLNRGKFDLANVRHLWILAGVYDD